MCRSPLAWMFNHAIPGATWITEANAGLGIYESGRPDGFAMPWMLPVECKADRGSLYTGDPDRPARKSKDWKEGDPSPEKKGFHTSQRHWLANVCRKPGAYVLYYMAVWINPSREGRIDHCLDRLFLVNVDWWLNLEYVATNQYDTRSVPLNPQCTNYKYRNQLNVEKWFSPFALDQYKRTTDTGKKLIAWRIPAKHPLWDDLRRHQLSLVKNINFQRNHFNEEKVL